MPIYRRLPKRGFTNPFRVANQAVNVGELAALTSGDVTPDTLLEAGLISHADQPAKILGTGDAARAYTVRGVATSASARAKIEAAGGSIEA
jgi:large subunit ribosomal protein L15